MGMKRIFTFKTKSGLWRFIQKYGRRVEILDVWYDNEFKIELVEVYLRR